MSLCIGMYIIGHRYIYPTKHFSNLVPAPLCYLSCTNFLQRCRECTKALKNTIFNVQLTIFLCKGINDY